MDTIKFAVLGLGHIGKRHVALINQTHGAVCVAGADIQNINPQLNIPFFNNIDSLLNSGIDFDVLNVCTPNGLHAEHAVKALEAKKHVVCEKPMALSKTDCESIIYKALQVSKQVFVVMQNRYSPPAQWLKSIVDSGKLGNILLVQMNCYWNRDDRYYIPGSWKGSRNLDGGVLFTQFSHFIDILYWVFGDIRNIHGRLANFTHKHNTEFEDSGLVSFELMNGGLGQLNYTTSVWNTNMESSITVVGSKGSIKVGGQYMDKVEYCHIEGYSMPDLPPTEAPNDYGFYKGSAANHKFIFENVVQTLNNLKYPTTNALEGMKNVEIIERIYKNSVS